jgi:energy-converting hydrogenase Eha subunit H
MANPRRLERNLIRILVALALAAAVSASVLIPVPLGEGGDPVLPATAFGQVILYRLEISLVVFYGSLLVITPAFLGLSRGRLPTEISARGAKFAEGTDRSAERNEAEIRRLEEVINNLADASAAMTMEIRNHKAVDQK